MGVEEMKAKKAMDDVVVLLPGILGSVLQLDGKDVWAPSPRGIFQGVTSFGGSVKRLRIQGVDDYTKQSLGDGVTAPRLVPDVHLIPGFWKIDGYTKIKQVMFERFDLTEGENWFDFPYDWRRDNRVAADRLAADAPRWLAQWKAKSGRREAKLVLLAHSMGGLVARHYLECLDGWKETRHLITFGTPYQGAVNAAAFLVNGLREKFGPFTVDLSDFLRSLTSVYQLAPRWQCIRDRSGNWGRFAETALPNVDAGKAKAALQFHRDIEAEVNRHREDENYRRQSYQIHPVVGILQPTLQSGRLVGDELVTSTDPLDPKAPEGGDGTVPRLSATPLEYADDPREVYASERHATLQNVDAVLANIYGKLTRTSNIGYKSTPFDGFALELKDLYRPDEPLVLTARTAGVADRAVATARNVDTGGVVGSETVSVGSDGSFAFSLSPVSPGVYRVSVGAADIHLGMNPVSDLFTVAGESE
jgi:hypothetical protein